MTVQPPPIDQRTYEDIVEQTKTLVERSSDWDAPKPPNQADAGLAMIRLFAHLAKQVSDRINQAPEKNFLAFLDLIGIELQPPQPARVPLTFTLATGTTADAFVPTHTQVSAPPQEGETEEAIFETEQELVVTPAQLTAVAVRNPEGDWVSDYTTFATGQGEGTFPVFGAEQPIEHCLYLAVDDLLGHPGTKTLTFTFNFDSIASTQLDTLRHSIRWSVWDGQTWQILTGVTTTVTSQPWQVTLPIAIEPQPVTIDGVSALWVQAKFTRPLPPGAVSLPVITNIQASIATAQPKIAPDLCFANTVPLDLSKDFYPFGEQPRFNDTFYVASDRTLAHPGSTVTIEVTPTVGLPTPANASANLELAWEVWTEDGWKAQPVRIQILDGTGRWIALPPPANSTANSTATTPPTAVAPTLTEAARITLTLPADVATMTLNGETRHWLRVRIVKGNYGEAAKVTGSGSSISFTAATYAPPSLGSITLKSNYTANASSIHCRTVNDFAFSNPLPVVEKTYEGDASSGRRVQVLWLDSTAGFAVGDRLRIPAEAAPSEANTYIIDTLYSDSPGVILDRPLATLPAPGTRLFRRFPLVHPTTDRRPTLYLGFDRPFSPRPVTLYAQVALPSPQEASHPQTIDHPAIVVWEYYSAKGWQPLAVHDETQAFAQRGLIQFLGPTDPAPRSDLGYRGLYWLRACWQGGTFRVMPRLRRVLTNTVWANQSQTMTNETLGSSNGNPDQRFQATQTPILLGAKLTVQEGQLPPPDEHRALRHSSGEDGVESVYDATGRLADVWVRWQAVPNFYGSGPRDRHYTLDSLTGEIGFGNGQRGLIPPLGRNNLRLSYRTGGGAGSDRPIHTIAQLKTTVPYIDSVTNLEPAGGGAPQESIAQVQVRGPRQLRHRDRAVAAQDFADLAFAASPEVARARAITPQFEPLSTDRDQNLWLGTDLPATLPPPHRAVQSGYVQVLIVPYSIHPQPVPSLGLMDRVERYLRQRCLPTVELEVKGPSWVKVTVNARVAVASLEGADVTRNEIMQKLNRFLHCLTGGCDGQGWNFGRQPHTSDFYALIESVPRVSWVKELTLDLDPTVRSDLPFLIYPGLHTITLDLSKGVR
ncbi:putative baseplate assembly protein [Leptolyngbya sp. AN02str]|uniref:putative baseplate assembly protein n=1 Tax=Leptolyngbya sp. AN02str TaxID=3423363 RepID=UPI003D31B6A4